MTGVPPQAHAVGQRILRLEDGPLIRGGGRFVDDLKFAGGLEAAFLRSPHAHAAIRSIDTGTACRLPGVQAIFTYADIAPMLTQGRLPLQFRTDQLPADVAPIVLAKDEVAYVGEAVALVVAHSRATAEDAAALVEIDYEPLPAISDCRAALQPGAALAHRGKTSNLLIEFKQSYGDVAGAFARAPRRARVNLKQHRGGAHSIEGRGAVAVYDANEDRLTLWTSTQLAHEVRAFLMRLLQRDENQMRVVAPDVGGGFGAKFVMYPEEVALSAASLRLRRPIKWIEDRREHFLAAVQERDQYWDIEAAFDGEGRVLGVRGELIHDQGAYTPQGLNLPYNASTGVPGPYIVPAYDLRVRVVETNKVATMPVRGAGYPEAAFAMERVLDQVARALGIDRAEVRRRNLVPAEKIPYVTPLKTRSGSPVALDSGDFPRCLDMALGAIDYAGFAERQRRAHESGRYLGIGVGNGVKGSGRGPFESGIVRVGRSGRISVYTGAMPMGQGIKTALAQICAEQFLVPTDSVTVVAGDTAVIPYGQGGFASRQTVTAGSAVHLAARAVREKLLKVAAHLLETGVEDLELRNGRVEVVGAPGSGLSFREVAEAVSGVPGYSMPGGFEPGLEMLESFMPNALTYGMGCHAVEVEVDVETGRVLILRYVVVNDSGRLINPMIVEGQLVGGTAHGIGNTLYEWMRYDDNAQPLTTTFADYLLASATEVPNIEVHFVECPSPLNPLGVKGVGESGCVPAAGAIVAAIEDALSPFGVTIGEYPVTPAKLFALITATRA
ncbi:MAG TPA: xanthine dehydrogenase family protein molybdopterin-binding subunit [Xanthobacteraceae bacterium]|nr:xanthine dehydrogenase family protein molybdopterin-binding subunit [Xanthobacteraceae bacterium]